MSKRNERYLRPGQTKGTKAVLTTQRVRIEKNRKNEDGINIVAAGTKSGFQGVQGREVSVKVRQPVVINMPKRSQKTKQTRKFPTLQRATKKDRLAIIKTRVLVLKYGYIWQKKTFGCVSPAKARKHYDKQLLKKSFQQWEDIWWNGRNEWKLNIRADYHNRFRLWLKIWRAWRSFMTVKKIKQTKMKLAKRKADHVYLKKCFAFWRSYVSKRQEKKQFYLNAQDQGKVLAKRAAFSRWKNCLAFKRKLLAMEEQALYVWARNLFYKAWECWIFNYNLAQEEKRKVAFAAQLYNRRLVFKVLGSFKLYGIQRKLKKLRLRSGERFHRLQSLRSWFLIWKATWRRKRELARFADAILCKGEEARKRRMFLAWKHYIILCHFKQHNEYKSWNHFQTSLKRKYLKALQKRVTDRKIKISLKETALRFYKTSLVKQAWNSWLKKCENCEELRLMSLNTFVRNHYNKVLLKRMMQAWRRYCQWRKLRQEDKLKANEMARRNLLPRCFERWEMFVEIVKERQKVREQAEEFRRECLLAKTYYHWWRSYQQTLDVQMLYRMAIISYDEKIKRKFFKTWLTKARWKLRENILLKRGQIHYERELKKKYLLKWNAIIKRINHSLHCVFRLYSVSRLEMAVRHQNTKLLVISWAQWTKFVCKKRKKWKLVAIANLSFHRRILKKTLSAWKIYSDNVKKIKSYAEERKRVYDYMLIRMLFQRWRRHARYLREAKETDQKSWRHWKFKTERKVFTAWWSYAVDNMWQRQHTLSKTAVARKQLEQGKLCRFFHAWRQCYLEKVAFNNKLRKATEHWTRHTLQKGMDMWLKYRFLGYRKLVLQQQCMWYHNRRIIVSSLNIWKANYQERVKFTKKSHLALWMWSFTLQRKAFIAWLHYAVDKKRRKSLINEALERRRCWLYKVGVTQWIKFASYSIAERETFAASRHIRLSQDVQQCVQRCALHWRRKTERNRGHRPQIIYRDSSPTWSKNIVIDTEKESQNVEIIGLPIPQAVKRPKPRRPEYLRESFNFSQILEEQTAVDTIQADDPDETVAIKHSEVSKATVSRKPVDDPEAFPRKWRSDFQPSAPPPRLQKPTEFSDSEGKARSSLPTYSLSQVVELQSSRDNHVLLPPSCFVGSTPVTTLQTGMTRGNLSVQVQQPNDTTKNTMPDFLYDRRNQQSIVELRNRMLKYYTLSKQLRDLRQRLKCLRQWTNEPREENDKLCEEEMNLIHEIISKLSEVVNTTSHSLDENYTAIAKDLEQLLGKVT